MKILTRDEYGNVEKGEVDRDLMRPGPIKHPPLTHPEAKKIMADLYETFKDLNPADTGPESWEEGFRRDHHMSREVAIFLKMRNVFSQVIRGHWNDLNY